MSVVLSAERPSAALKPQPAGLPCRGCKALFGSSWRGPGSQWCAKYKCKQEAARARETMLLDDKDARIDELEERVDAQHDELTRLKAEVRVTHLVRSQAPPLNTHAGTRRPLEPRNENAQQEPERERQALPAAKRPKRTLDATAEPLPRGWTSRPSKTRPGELTYVYAEHNVLLKEAPCSSRDGKLLLQEDLVKQLIGVAKQMTDGAPVKVSHVGRLLEKCLDLDQGTTKAEPLAGLLGTTLSLIRCEEETARKERERWRASRIPMDDDDEEAA